MGKVEKVQEKAGAEQEKKKEKENEKKEKGGTDKGAELV